MPQFTQQLHAELGAAQVSIDSLIDLLNQDAAEIGEPLATAVEMDDLQSMSSLLNALVNRHRATDKTVGTGTFKPWS